MTNSAQPIDTSSEKSPRDPLARNVKLLGFASLLNDISSEMIFPLLPHFVMTVLGGSRTSLGMIEGAADSLSSLLKLASGHWSDRSRSRRLFILVGYTLTALTRPGLAAMTAAWQVAAARLVDRFGKGVRSAPRDALIADSTAPSERGRAYGFNRAMDHLGATIGPLLATAFLWFWPGELRWLFALTMIPGLCLIALIGFGLKDPPKEKLETKEPSNPLLAMKPFDGRFRLFLVSLVIFTLGNSSDAFLLVRAGELGVTTAWLPILWGSLHIVKGLGNWWVGPLVEKIGSRRLIVVGWSVYSIVYLLFAFANQVWHAWALFLLYGLFYACTESAEKVLVVDLVGQERRGLAFGWFHAAIGIATLPASILFGTLYDKFGGIAAFGTSAGLALMASLVLLAVRPNPIEQTSDASIS